MTQTTAVPWPGIAYAAFFLCVLLKGLPESWRTESATRFVLELIPYAVGTAGMLIYLADRGSPLVASVWRFCFPLIVLGSLSDVISDLTEMWATPDPRATSLGADHAFTILAAVTSLSLQLPYFWMNWCLLP